MAGSSGNTPWSTGPVEAVQSGCFSTQFRIVRSKMPWTIACAASGAYQPKIGLTLLLEKIADAHLAQEAGRVVGKILLSIHS
jgi:hypothetical protein